jgi:hypothetical protein
MSDQSTSASDGSVGVFPGEAGLVGTPNSAGIWVMWIPAPGVRYDATEIGQGMTEVLCYGTAVQVEPVPAS